MIINDDDLEIIMTALGRMSLDDCGEPDCAACGMLQVEALKVMQRLALPVGEEVH